MVQVASCDCDCMDPHQRRLVPVSSNQFDWCIVGVSASIIGITSLVNLHDIIGTIQYLEEAYKTMPVLGHT